MTNDSASDSTPFSLSGNYPPRLWLLAALAFIVSLALCAALIRAFERSHFEERRQAVAEVTTLHALEIGNRLERALSASFALAAIVRQGNGKINGFDRLAKEMIRAYGGIGALQLAPGGTISQIVPLAGNEKVIGSNPLSDPEQRIDAQKAVDQGRLVLSGPFKLMQGGFGVVGRYPVFLTDQRDEQVFWGFVQVIVRIPELLSVSHIGTLEAASYRYELWHVDPVSGERVVFARSSSHALKSPVNAQIVVPDGSWTLSVEPVSSELFIAIPIGGGLMSLLVSTLAAIAVFFRQREALLLQRDNEIRSAAQAELQRSSELLREIIDTIDRAIILWDRDQCLVVWNDAVEKMYPEIAHLLQVGMMRTEFREIRETVGERGLVQEWESIGVWDRNLPDGRIVEVQRLAMADGGRLVLHADVTEERMRNEVLARSERMVSLGKLVAGIAHEINTPIGNALLVATTLRDQSAAMEKTLAQGTFRRSALESFMSTVHDSGEMLLRNLARAAKLILHFKAMAVDQTGEQRRKFRLAAVFEDVTTTLQQKVRLSSHVLEVELDPALSMDSYPGALGQIVSNLVENALLHAFPERTCGVMRLEARVHGEHRIEIVFSDNGVGIAAEHLSRVFEPFFTTKLGKGGSGLGLSIVLNLVRDLLGGEISVHSPGRQGTKIRLLLPRIAPGKR